MEINLSFDTVQNFVSTTETVKKMDREELIIKRDEKEGPRSHGVNCRDAEGILKGGSKPWVRITCERYKLFFPVRDGLLFC